MERVTSRLVALRLSLIIKLINNYGVQLFLVGLGKSLKFSRENFLTFQLPRLLVLYLFFNSSFICIMYLNYIIYFYIIKNEIIFSKIILYRPDQSTKTKWSLVISHPSYQINHLHLW